MIAIMHNIYLIHKNFSFKKKLKTKYIFKYSEISIDKSVKVVLVNVDAPHMKKI
jgi:hypothetical protein